MMIDDWWWWWWPKKPPPISEDDGLFFPLSKLTGPILPATKKKTEKKLSVRGAPHYIEFVLAHATHPQLFAQSSKAHSFAHTKSLYTPFSLTLSLSLFLSLCLHFSLSLSLSLSLCTVSCVSGCAASVHQQLAWWSGIMASLQTGCGFNSHLSHQPTPLTHSPKPATYNTYIHKFCSLMPTSKFS